MHQVLTARSESPRVWKYSATGQRMSGLKKNSWVLIVQVSLSFQN
jgi:hypothetical protein